MYTKISEIEFDCDQFERNLNFIKEKYNLDQKSQYAGHHWRTEAFNF